MTEADVRNLQRQIDGLREEIKEMRTTGNARHDENSRRLQSIDLTLKEFTTALSIGRYVMNLLWGIAGTAAGALVMKWLSKT